MNLVPKQILEEIEKRRSSFPALAEVHEIWIVETIFSELISTATIFGSSCTRTASKQAATISTARSC